MPDGELIGLLGEIGWSMSGPAGPVPTTSAEIMAWSAGMGETLTPWQFRVLRNMSRAYVHGYYADHAPYEPTLVRLGLATASME